MLYFYGGGKTYLTSKTLSLTTLTKNIALAFLLLFFTAPCFAQSQGEVGYSFTQGELTYTIVDLSSVSGYFSDFLCVSVRAANTSISGVDGVLTIPDLVTDGGTDYPVDAIEEEGFKDCTNLRRIIVGECVQDCGDGHVFANAFNGCTNLEYIRFNTIDYFAVTDDNGDIFEGCTNLDSILISFSIQSLEYMYNACGSKDLFIFQNSGTVLLPGVDPIYKVPNSFLRNDLLYKVYDAENHYAEVDAFYPYVEYGWFGYDGRLTIPPTVTINGEEYTVNRFAVGSSAFVVDMTTSIHEISIPNTIADIRPSDLPLADSYLVAADHPSCTTIDGSLYSKSSPNKLVKAKYTMTVLPTRVDTIGEYALSQHARFENSPIDQPLSITHDVKYVEDKAFQWIWANINITETGSLPLCSNYNRQGLRNDDFIDGHLLVHRQLPVDEFSLISGGLMIGNAAEDFSLRGTTSGVDHSAVVLPFYYAGNTWGVDAVGSGASGTYEVNAGEAYFVYPTSYNNSDGTTPLADSYVTTEVLETYTVDDLSITLTNNNAAKWFALANPFAGRLNLSKFYASNAAVLNNTHAYVWDNVTEHDWVDWADIDAENKYALRPCTGFMVEGASANPTFNFNLDDQVTGETITTHKSSSLDKLEFMVLSNGIAKKMYAHIDDVSSNGFGRMDASVLCSSKEDAVNPYMQVEGHNLLDNYFSSLPATFDVNFNAYKSNTIDFALTQGMEDVEVTLVDIANTNAETVLNVNEPVSIDVTAGQNEGRYQLRFSKKNVGINEVASEDNSIQIWNNNREVTINGKDLKRVEIFNTLGQMVYSSNLAGNSTTFDSKLNDGAYIVKVYTANSSKSEKIIIR